MVGDAGVGLDGSGEGLDGAGLGAVAERFWSAACATPATKLWELQLAVISCNADLAISSCERRKAISAA